MRLLASTLANKYLKGKKASIETRKKQSLAKIGKATWNKGKKGVQVAWNKGLTKETSGTMKLISEQRMGEGNPMYKKAKRKKYEDLG